MRYFVSIDENLGDVSVYRLNDFCDDSTCEDQLGSFWFERSGEDVVVHGWNFEEHDWLAAQYAANYFALKYCKDKSVNMIYVERSEADRFWQLLGWEQVGKCEMLERRADACV